MKFVALGLALSLAACASPRGPEVAYQGVLAPGSRTYAFAGSDRQPERVEIEAAVGRQLAADGYAQVERSPDYVVEVLFSARPAKVGAYEKLAGADTPDWNMAPVKTPWWRLRKPTLGEVTIRFVEAKSGVETYRATATGRSDIGKTAAEAAAQFDELAQAAARPPVT